MRRVSVATPSHTNGARTPTTGNHMPIEAASGGDLSSTAHQRMDCDTSEQALTDPSACTNLRLIGDNRPMLRRVVPDRLEKRRVKRPQCTEGPQVMM